MRGDRMGTEVGRGYAPECAGPGCPSELRVTSYALGGGGYELRKGEHLKPHGPALQPQRTHPQAWRVATVNVMSTSGPPS